MKRLAGVARMSEAISGILLNTAHRFAHAGYLLATTEVLASFDIPEKVTGLRVDARHAA